MPASQHEGPSQSAVDIGRQSPASFMRTSGSLQCTSRRAILFTNGHNDQRGAPVLVGAASQRKWPADQAQQRRGLIPAPASRQPSLVVVCQVSLDVSCHGMAWVSSMAMRPGEDKWLACHLSSPDLDCWSRDAITRRGGDLVS